MENSENFGQNMPGQQTGYVPPGGQYMQPGPSIGSLLTKSHLAKIGLVLLIISIIGLIISYAVPWGYVDADGVEEKTFGHDLENMDGQNLATFFLLISDPDDYGDYFTGTPVMADIGFVFLLILGVLAMVLGMASSSYKGNQSIMSFLGLLIGAITLLPTIFIFVAGMRFVGLNVIVALNGDMYKDTTILFPAAYVILIFGIICFLLVIKMIKEHSAMLSGGDIQKSVSSQMYYMKGGGNQ